MCANAFLRRLGHPSGARGLARGCHCDAATMSTSAGWPRADTAAHARGYGFARACLRARRGGGAPQPSALALALDEPATHHAVSSTAASWRSFCLRDLICRIHTLFLQYILTENTAGGAQRGFGLVAMSVEDARPSAPLPCSRRRCAGLERESTL